MSENIENREMVSPAQVPDIPYIAHESAMARMERHIKRLWIALIVALLVILGTNIGWLIYEAQFDTISYTQDGAGLNNINTGEQGDVFGAEAAREAQAERQG